MFTNANMARGGVGRRGPRSAEGIVASRFPTTTMRQASVPQRPGHVRVIRSWDGIVENTPEGRPIPDRLEDPGNVVVASMSSVGFGLSPATERALAQLVLQGRCDFADLSRLGLARFGNLPMDWRSRQGRDALRA